MFAYLFVSFTSSQTCSDGAYRRHANSRLLQTTRPYRSASTLLYACATQAHCVTEWAVVSAGCNMLSCLLASLISSQVNSAPCPYIQPHSTRMGPASAVLGPCGFVWWCCRRPVLSPKGVLAARCWGETAGKHQNSTGEATAAARGPRPSRPPCGRYGEHGQEVEAKLQAPGTVGNIVWD